MSFFNFPKKFIFKNAKAVTCATAILLSLILLTGCAKSDNSQHPNTEKSERPVFSLSEDESSHSLPSVSAESAILIEADSGRIIGSKNADERLSMASTTKIMTALVAIENCDVTKKITVDRAAVGIEGSSVYLYEGEILTLEDLLYAMLLESANDAAAAIAIAIGGSIEDFAEMMNQKAIELGLENTHFTNPHGLDNEEHYTIAKDLAIIAAVAMQNETFKTIVSTYKKTIPLHGSEGVRLLINHNKLLKNYDGAVGIKTGYTKKSGRCLVSAAERDGVKLISVTLNAPDDWKDHATMLEYGFSLYESRLLCSAGEIRQTLPIIGGNNEYVTLTNASDVTVTLPKDTENIKCDLELCQFEYAPVTKGEVLGYAIYSLGETTVAKIPLCAEYSVDRIIYKKSLWEGFTSLFDK